MLIWPISLNSKEIFKCWHCIMRHLSIGCWAYLNNFCRAHVLWMGYVWNKKTDWKPRITNSLVKCLIQASLLGPSKRRGDIQTLFFSLQYYLPQSPSFPLSSHSPPHNTYMICDSSMFKPIARKVSSSDAHKEWMGEYKYCCVWSSWGGNDPYHHLSTRRFINGPQSILSNSHFPELLLHSHWFTPLFFSREACLMLSVNFF